MRARFALAAALLIAPYSAGADSSRDGINWDRIDLAEERAAIEQFQSFEQRLQDVGWQMVRGNAEFCERVIPSVGLQLQDLASYGSPQIARAALDMTGNFAVQTAARGSPSALSGAFPANREVTRLAGVNPNGWEAGARLDWRRLSPSPLQVARLHSSPPSPSAPHALSCRAREAALLPMGAGL